jgi:hyperosmotically inducible protein
MRRLLGALVIVTLVAGPAMIGAATAAESIGKKVDDAAVLTKVKTKLATDNAKSLVKVNVDVKDGVVHLKGTVPTEADKAQAEKIAQNTDGVTQVVNELMVNSPSASPSTK